MKDGVSGMAGLTSLMGPQAERRAAWLQRDEELPPPPRERDTLLLETAAERKVYEQELVRLRSENDFLKDQINRISKELKAYQLKYPSAHSRPNFGDDGTERLDPDLPPWVTSPDTMVPLLKAYDIRVAELEEQESLQRSQLDILQGRVEALVAENERLRESQIDDFDRMFSAQQGAETVMDEELIKDLNERIAVLMAQNALMNDQTTVMGQQLDASQMELAERDHTIQQLTNGLGEASNTLQYLETQLEELRSEKEQAEGSLLKQTGALASTDEELRSTKEELLKSEEETKQLEAALEELRRAFQASQDRFEKELDSMAGKVQASAAEVAEIRSKFAAKSQEANAYGDQLRKARRELETTRADAEGMLQVLSGMEKQIAEYSAREEGVAKLSRESRQKVEDALLARDQSRALEAQSRRELARVLERRKAESESAQQDLETAVAACRQRLQSQIDSRDREVKDLIADNAALQTELSKYKREKDDALNKYKGIKDLVREMEASLEIKFNDLRNRIIEADRAKEEEEAGRYRLEQVIKELEQELHGKAQEWRLEKTKVEDLLKLRERELDNLRNDHRAALDKSERKDKDAQKANKEVEALRMEHRERLEELVREREKALLALRLEVREADLKAKEAERQANEDRERFDHALDKIRVDKDAEIQSLQRRLNEETGVSQRMGSRQQELSGKNEVLTAENTQLRMDIQHIHDSHARLESSIRDYQQTVSELNYQLANSLAQQEKTGSENAKLKGELTRLRKEHENMEREKQAYKRILNEPRAYQQSNSESRGFGHPYPIHRPSSLAQHPFSSQDNSAES